MDPEKLKALIEEAVSNTDPFAWWFYLIILLGPAIGAFFGSYLRKKAENFATKEDIESITDKIEKVRSQYNEQLEAVKASLQLSNQLKLAALDTRLHKHQEAYTLWLNLMWSLYDDKKIGPAVTNCQNWWNENCLYLGEESRGAFKTALILAGQFRGLIDAKEKRKWFNSINDAGKKIIEDVNLPSLGEDEIENTELDSNENHNNCIKTDREK